MDQACFEVWLEGIQSLTAEQRGLGFCEPALAEAAGAVGPVGTDDMSRIALFDGGASTVFDVLPGSASR